MSNKTKFLLAILRKEQKKNRYVSEAALKRISSETGIPVSRVYGVATFYSMIHLEKQGKHIIYVCNSPSCHVNGSMGIIKYLEEKLKIHVGEMTNDKKFSLFKTSCIGCCDKAPAMLIDGKAYTELSKKKIDSILSKLK